VRVALDPGAFYLFDTTGTAIRTPGERTLAQEIAA
jgi:hypothetical protein